MYILPQRSSDTLFGPSYRDSSLVSVIEFGYASDMPTAAPDPLIKIRSPSLRLPSKQLPIPHQVLGKMHAKIAERTADIVALTKQAHIDKCALIVFRIADIATVEFGRVVKRHELRTALPLLRDESFPLWLVEAVLKAFTDELANWEMLDGGFWKRRK